MFDQRKYYKKNRRKLLGRQKRRNEARKTDIKSYMERYYKKNRDDILAHQKLYYYKNVGYYRNYMKTYHKKRGKSS